MRPPAMRLRAMSMSRKRLVVALVAVVVSCVAGVVASVLLRGYWRSRQPFVQPPGALQNPGAAIVGGTDAAFERYPWFCSVGINGSISCGGALVGPTTVWTAGHCIVPGTALRVLIGGWEVRDVLHVLKWPIGDIAVLTLTKPSTLPPIKLAARLPSDGTAVTVLGRGKKTGRVTSVSDKTFQKAALTYVNSATAVRLLQAESAFGAKQESALRVARLPSFFLTVSPKGTTPCFGDSGGPLIIERGPGKDELLGVVSRSPQAAGGPCELAGTRYMYTFYTSVPHFLQTRPAVEAGLRAMQQCAYVGRVRQPNGTYRCPKPYVWDTGVTEDNGSSTFIPRQCAITQQCAQTVNDLQRLEGAPLGGVWQHRY